MEYKMSKEMAKDLLNTRKGEDKKMEPQKYLCKFVNEQFGLMGECLGVKID